MKIVEDFEQAVRDHEMKGAGYPEEHAFIELRYKVAKQKLIEALKKKQTK